MRLFTAIELPQTVREQLQRARAKLAAAQPELDAAVTWVKAENLHVTLKFLGHLADERLPEICDALKSVEPPGPTALQPEGIEFFPERGPVRVCVARVGGEVDQLAVLFDRVEQALEPLGFERERRRYRPHVTLARVRSGRRVPGSVRRSAAEQPAPRANVFDADLFTLFESRLKSTGAEYVPLARFPILSR